MLIIVPPWTMWVGLLLLVLASRAMWQAWRAAAAGRLVEAQAVAIVLSVAWCWVMCAGVAPASKDLWISLRVAALADAGPVALVGFQEDSAVFLLRGRAQRLEPEELHAWALAHPTGTVAIDARALPEAARALLEVLDQAGTVDGYNYTVGRRVRVEVFGPRESK